MSTFLIQFRLVCGGGQVGSPLIVHRSSVSLASQADIPSQFSASCSLNHVVPIGTWKGKQKVLDLGRYSTIMLVIVWSALIWLAYVVFSAIYRLYFHPLSRFPGPRVAALTRWYEFYYDVIKPGQFIWKIESLHKRYGTLNAEAKGSD